MRILFLTQWFDPEPVFKGLLFAKELSKLGHHVEVLTGFPNYPNGKVYPGYKIRLWQRQVMDGIPVIRVALYPSHDQSSLKRIANYVSFSLSAAAIGTLLTEAPDVVYVYNLVTLGLAAILLKTFKKCAIVYDIQDLWPDALKVSGMLRNRMAIGIVDRWCKFVYGMADRIVVLSPGFKAALASRGVPSDKTEVIYNWCDEGAIRHQKCHPAVTTQIGLGGRFNIVFAGTMGKAQALDVVLDAAKLLFKKPEPIQFVFVGGGIEVEHLKQKAASMNLKNVLFLPRRPTSEIEEILSLADVLLVHLRADPLFAITIPSKIMAYMATGKPILAAMEGDAADLVEKANAGVVCMPGNPESIAEKVVLMFNLPRAALEKMGRNGQRFYDKELSLHTAVHRFDEVFKSCGMLNS